MAHQRRDHEQTDQCPGHQQQDQDAEGAGILPDVAGRASDPGEIGPGEQETDHQLHDRIARWDHTPAVAAPAAQNQPAQDWNIVAGAACRQTEWATGPRAHQTQSHGNSMDADIEKAPHARTQDQEQEGE